jgi:hypothetical protein
MGALCMTGESAPEKMHTITHLPLLPGKLPLEKLPLLGSHLIKRYFLQLIQIFKKLN